MNQSTTDNINHPPHYLAQPVECIEFTEHLPFNTGNAVKYLWRFKNKNGAEDLKKARWYLNRELVSGREPCLLGLGKTEYKQLIIELGACKFEIYQKMAIFEIWCWAGGIDNNGLANALLYINKLLEPQTGGRRKYASNAERQRVYRERKKQKGKNNGKS